MGSCIIILCPRFFFFFFFFVCHLLTFWFTQDACLFRSGFVSTFDAGALLQDSECPVIRSTERKKKKGPDVHLCCFSSREVSSWAPEENKMAKTSSQSQGMALRSRHAKNGAATYSSSNNNNNSSSSGSSNKSHSQWCHLPVFLSPRWPALTKPVLSFFLHLRTCFLIVDNPALFDRKCYYY